MEVKAVQRSPPRAVIADEASRSFVDLYPEWLSAAASDELFRQLSEHVLPHMDHDRGVMYGKPWTSKRLVGTISTGAGVSYSYSSVKRLTMQLTFAELPWLDDIRRQMEELCGHKLNFVFLNFYRPSTDEHPDDQLGWHSDDEVDMVAGASIVSLSVGDTRTFAFRKKGETGQYCATPLAQGDVAIMRGNTQTHYQHAVTTKGVKLSKRGRWNLTFRQFRDAPAAPNDGETPQKRQKV